MRRTLGFKLTGQARILREFIGYCEAHAVEHLTVESALRWATRTPTDSQDVVWWSRRLMVVRIFARHLAALDPATEIPPTDMLCHHKRRVAPYLYSPDQISDLITAAGRLDPPLRAATWQTFIGLLAVTGMRKSEACNLDRDHVDFDTATLIILDSKFGKSRQVLLHPTTVAVLRDYRQRRDQCFPEPVSASFFVNTRGKRLNIPNIGHTFTVLLAAAGIEAEPWQRPPRVHDLRHSFAVATLLDWYRDGGDVQARLPLLSTWLGHVDPKSTYWYLQHDPELLLLAAGRLEQHLFGDPS
jgi:integrase